MSDPAIAALDRRIDVLESREAIAGLLYRYTEAIRRRSPDDVLDLMLGDAVVELHHADPNEAATTRLMVRYQGRDEIRGSFNEQAGSDARVWPMLHNLRIDVVGDEASSVCVLQSAVWPAGKEFVGEYRDTFKRIDGHWLIASRRHIGFGDTTGQFAVEAHRAYQASKAG